MNSSGNRFPVHVLREYALLADGERGVLVGPRGDFSWMCVPRWDSDPVFCSLVGGNGMYAVTPTDRFVWGGYYEDGTLIWRSRWVTSAGIVECREALAFPGDPHRAVVLRQIRAREGTARLDVTLNVRREWGHAPMRGYHHDDGAWSGEVGGLHVRWQAGDGVRQHTSDGGSVLDLHLELAPGARHDLVLELSDQPLDDELPSASRAWASTIEAWEREVPPLQDTISVREARHSYAVLRGLTSSGGGMVAAATTSLPERADSGRNYDYRFVWIRDQCYAGEAAAAVRGTNLLDSAVQFVEERLLADGPKLIPAYTTSGDPVPRQRTVDVPGYPGGGAAVGNHVRDDFQLDMFGEALLLFTRAAELDRLDADGWRAAEIAVDAIAERWREPDNGVWEISPKHWTHSRLICVAGLNAISGVHPGKGRVRDWLALSDTILGETARTAVHSTGRWQRAVEDDRVDAALLLPPIRGAVPADDPRVIRTIDAVRHDLAQSGYVYRFREQGLPLGEAEGAFLLCGFFMALAAHQQHKPTEAARWMERNLTACGPPGLYSEEYDVLERQMRGNLPQAFVHALALETTARLAVPSDQPAGLH